MAMNIVILAAGQGKRMKSALPKVLQPLAGKPLLEYVLEIAISLIKAAEPIVVIGHGAEHVNAFLGDLASRNPSFKAIKTVLQKEQKGTGHALLQTITKLNKDLKQKIFKFVQLTIENNNRNKEIEQLSNLNDNNLKKFEESLLNNKPKINNI